MITFKQFITEARAAPLYHAVDVNGFIHIAHDNKIIAATQHKHNRTIRGSNHRWEDVISLTRDIRFAKRWGAYSSDWRGEKSYVVLELDQQKLIQNYKMRPYNHFQDQGDESWGRKARELEDVKTTWREKFPVNQYEENVFGDIKPLSKYLVKVHYSSNTHPDDLKKIMQYKDKLNVPFVADLLDRTKV